MLYFRDRLFHIVGGGERKLEGGVGRGRNCTIEPGKKTSY